MTVAGSNLTVDSTATPGATQTTASISPGSNRLILAAVAAHDLLDATPPTVSLSGNGLTWVQVARRTLAPAISLAVFRAMGASPSSGAVTISSDVVSIESATWIISEFTGINTGGTNGSAAVGNIADNGASAASSLTVTLPAFGSSNNGTYGAFLFLDGTLYNINPGSGFTELGETTIPYGGAYYVVAQAQWRADNDTSVDGVTTPTTTLDNALGIAIEIVAAAAGATTNLRAGKLIRGGILRQGLR